MDLNLSQRIRQRAYEIWAASGCPDGQAEQHWLTAEREILEPPKTALATRPDLVKKSSARARRAIKRQ